MAVSVARGDGGRGPNPLYSMLLSPPLFLLPAFGLAFVLGDGWDASLYPPAFTMGIVSIYAILTVAYCVLCRKREMKYATSVAAITDGLLLIYLSGVFRTGTFFSISGLLLLLAGMVAIIVFILPPTETLFARRAEEIVSGGVDVSEVGKILESLPYPCAFLERRAEGERIVACNGVFAGLFDLDKRTVEGAALDALLPAPSERDTFLCSGAEWVARRTTKGRQVMLMLAPAERTAEPPKFEIFDAIDPLTGLYAIGFMRHKAKSDIESVIRGKRKLSAVLFKLSFYKTAEVEASEDEQQLSGVAFARGVLGAIRACDSAYKVSRDEVLLLMPDTSSDGAEVVVSRIYNVTRNISREDCPGISKSRLYHARRDFVGGLDLPQHSKILDVMSKDLYAKNPDI